MIDIILMVLVFTLQEKPYNDISNKLNSVATNLFPDFNKIIPYLTWFH